MNFSCLHFTPTDIRGGYSSRAGWPQAPSTISFRGLRDLGNVSCSSIFSLVNVDGSP